MAYLDPTAGAKREGSAAAITAADLAADSVEASEIAAGAVGTSEIATGGVGTADVADDAITLAKLAVPKIGKISQTILASQFTDGGGASGTKTLTTQIPAGAVFLHSRALVNVAFSGDTTAVVTIGDGSDVDRYNTGTPSVFTTGQKDLGVPSGARDHLVATTVTVTITGGSDFGAVNTLGSLTVDLYYLQTA